MKLFISKKLAAAAILLIDRAPQGAEHLKQILTGNILTVGVDELVVIASLYAAIGLAQWALHGRFAQGSSFVWEFLFYASFGIVVTSSVATAGDDGSSNRGWTSAAQCACTSPVSTTGFRTGEFTRPATTRSRFAT